MPKDRVKRKTKKKRYHPYSKNIGKKEVRLTTGYGARTATTGAISPINKTLMDAALAKYTRENPSQGANKRALDFILVAGPDQVKDMIFLQTGTSSGPLRPYIEPLGAGSVGTMKHSPTSSQCGHASLSNPEDLAFKKGQTLCWLCSCPITSDDWSESNGPQCEHILPALRAVMTVGMFTTGSILNNIKKSGNYDDAEWLRWNQETADNYLWSHAACNGSAGKSDMLLLGYDETTGEFAFNDTVAAELQYKIFRIYTGGTLKLPKIVNGQSCYNPLPGSHGGGAGGQGMLWRVYGNCPEAVNGRIHSIDNKPLPDDWSAIDTQQCYKVKNPYEAMKFEMKRATKGINERWREFGGNLPAFAEYCLQMVKLYLSAKGLKLAMSDAQIAAQEAQQDATDARARAKASKKYDEVIDMLTGQMVIMKNFQKASILFYNSRGNQLVMSMGSRDEEVVKTATRNQIEQIFVTYCASAQVGNPGVQARFCNQLMSYLWVNPQDGSTPVSGGLVEALKLPNGVGIFSTAVNIMVLFAIVTQFGAENLVKMPWGANNMKSLSKKDQAMLDSKYEKLRVDAHYSKRHEIAENKKEEEKLLTLVRLYGTEIEIKSSGELVRKLTTKEERARFGLGRYESGRFEPPTYTNMAEVKPYLEHQIAILVGMLLRYDGTLNVQAPVAMQALKQGISELEKKKQELEKQNMGTKEAEESMRVAIERGEMPAGKSIQDAMRGRIAAIFNTNSYFLELKKILSDITSSDVSAQRREVLNSIFSVAVDGSNLPSETLHIVGCSYSQKAAQIASHVGQDEAEEYWDKVAEFFCYTQGIFPRRIDEGQGGGVKKTCHRRKRKRTKRRRQRRKRTKQRKSKKKRTRRRRKRQRKK